MKFGLSEGQFQKILGVLREFPGISEAILFGSRAKGSFKSGSDIDIALKSKTTKLKLSTVNKILEKFEDLELPYTFDIILYDQIENQDLIDHIKRVGIDILAAD